MGSCIGKCMPSKHSMFDDEHDHLVQDKLVVSQASSVRRPAPLFNKISTSPPPPSSSRSTSSSLLTTSGSGSCVSSTSSCSSLSAASSGLGPRERPFSNDFLVSCIKENPHVLRISSFKASSCPVSFSPDRILERGVESPARWPILIPQMSPGPPGTVLQKRVRSSSPNLTRQKSMRITDHKGFAGSHPLPSRVSRSPSPSRRFNREDKNTGTLANTAKERIGSRQSEAANEAAISVCSMSPSTCQGKEYMRIASPGKNPSTIRLRERAMSTGGSFGRQIGAKVEEIASKFSCPGAVGSADDIHNPLISLDCFIFL